MGPKKFKSFVFFPSNGVDTINNCKDVFCKKAAAFCYMEKNNVVIKQCYFSRKADLRKSNIDASAMSFFYYVKKSRGAEVDNIQNIPPVEA